MNSVNTSVPQVDEFLTANETGANYQWLLCPAMTPISSATDQSCIATSIGDYAVEITNGTCIDTAACINVAIIGIRENRITDQIKLFPNPTNGNFTLNLNGQVQFISITMTDLISKQIWSYSYSGAEFLNLSIDEPAGLYLLVIESAKEKTVIRIVKK
ncbi:MAG: hypothetical protein ACI857_002609 [Arenicella sp.]|jgi:hypothetical protein